MTSQVEGFVELGGMVIFTLIGSWVLLTQAEKEVRRLTRELQELEPEVEYRKAEGTIHAIFNEAENRLRGRNQW